MLRFRVGRIPVSVHVSHLVVSALFAWSLAGLPLLPGSWPTEVLADPAHPQHATTQALLVGAWLLMVTGSVLVHELGHASAAAAFGHRPQIHLVGLGGVTQAEGVEAMPWHQEVLYTLAGPGAGLALGVAAGGLQVVWQRLGTPPPLAAYVLLGLFWTNLLWTALNLVPFASLDGGRITAAVLTKVLGRPGFLVAQVLSLALVVAALAYGAARENWFVVALSVLLAMRTFANISAYNQGALPLGEGRHPLLERVLAAEAAFAAGDYPEAERAARVVLAQEPPPMVRSRAHAVLGWVDLKQGRGTSALQQFNRAPGVRIPPQALAAAWSLAGDEARALPLWVEAARRTPGDLLLHELAGSLIRAGREPEARRLPGVRPGLAYAAAERVYTLRGEHAQAAQAAEAAFREDPAPGLAYGAACAWARAGQAEAALRMLALAAQNGFADADAAERDPDLQSLRARPDFQAWLAGLKLSPAS